MSDSKTFPPVALEHDLSDPPPAYSPLIRPSHASVSEISITSRLDNESQFGDFDDSDGLEERDESLAKRLTLEPTPYALAFVERFRRPNCQVQVITQTTQTRVAEVTNYPPLRDRNVSLDIMVMVVGEAIDTFINLSKRLVNDSHRVRVAAYARYGPLITKNGLDFWQIDQSRMNSGTFESCLANLTRQQPRADLQQTRSTLFGTYVRCWEACISPTGNDPRPFVADAIIASPLAHAHIHCADRLSIPLHIMSSIPCSPTEEYAHPASLAMVEASEEKLSNLLSYAMVEEATWATIIDPINHFRQHTLGLNRIHPDVAGRLMQEQAIPHTFFCSNELIKRPKDWSDTLQISGYPFAEHEFRNYEPSKALKNILQSSAHLVYFMIDPHSLSDPSHFARLLSEATDDQGLCILLPSVWGDLVDTAGHTKIFLTDGAPDDWIIPQVNVVVHTASIQSTALALRYGKPSVTITFNREQTGRAQKIARAGAGVMPFSPPTLTPLSLVKAVYACLNSDIQSCTLKIRRKAESKGKSGLDLAAQSFYRWIALCISPCSITEHELATYQIIEKPDISLSAAVASVLLQEKLLKRSEIELIRQVVYDIAGEGVVKAGFKNTKVYFDAFANAAHDIASSSNLVGMIQRKTQPDRGGKRSVANEIGIGTAKFFGNIALLPFTSTALVVNTVTYGIKTAKSLSSNRPQNDDDYGSDRTYKKSSSSAYSSTTRLSRNVYSDEGDHNQNNDNTENGDNSSQVSKLANMKNDINSKQQVRSVATLQSERGFRDSRMQDTEFRRWVVEQFKKVQSHETVGANTFPLS